MRIIDLNSQAAKDYLERSECYFRSDFPAYISFAPILKDTAKVLNGNSYFDFQKDKGPRVYDMSGVNYELLSTKDGRFSWRPFELIHPAIYITLVQLICSSENWKILIDRFNVLHDGVVECTSFPMVSKNENAHDATQVRNWWLNYEQRSLALSLEYTHLLKTDVSNCYGSLYTHSIVWALHGLDEAKEYKHDKDLLGNQIDKHICNSRYGQTNGITQGSVLMDIIAELVLAYVNSLITAELRAKFGDKKDFHILRYRDDYSVFTHNDQRGGDIVKVISDCLRKVGMQLGAAKTAVSYNVISGSIKPEKLAALALEDMDVTQAKTIQKQLLRLHAFARLYPNTGAVKRLVENMRQKITNLTQAPDDLDIQVAIICDIAIISPSAFPALSGIIAKLISLEVENKRTDLWEKVVNKIQLIPYNGYLDIWMQRITKPKAVGVEFFSNENICKIVDGKSEVLWNNSWIASSKLCDALDVKQIVVDEPECLDPVPSNSELALFREYAEFS